MPGDLPPGCTQAHIDAAAPQPHCDWCGDTQLAPNRDDEAHCPECCPHPEPLMLPPGPGFYCEACLDYFHTRKDAQASREANRENRR